jgi:hypothetical protein
VTGSAASGIAAGSSIWATSARILSGGAASQRSSWARSASSSGARRSCPNRVAAVDGAPSVTVIVASR